MKHRDEESSASDSLRGNSRLEEVIRPTTTRYIVFACFLSFFLSPRGDFFLLFRGDARSIKLLARIFQQEIYRAQSHSNAANTRRRSQALNASTPISPTIMPRWIFRFFHIARKQTLFKPTVFKRTRENSFTLFRKNR